MADKKDLNIPVTTINEAKHIVTEKLLKNFQSDDKSVTMTAKVTSAVEDNRIEDLTRSVLALDAGFEAAATQNHHIKDLKRYHQAMKSVLPFRFEKITEDELPMTKAGCISQMTFSWQTSMMWNIYRKGIDCISHLNVSATEQADINAKRLARLWSQELMEKGSEKASFGHASMVFMRTRLILGAILLLVTVMLQCAVPAFLLHAMLLYLNAGNVKVSVGVGFVVAIVAAEFTRTLTFGLGWYYNYTTGIRVRAAATSLLYNKILKLRSLEDKTVGEIVNLLGNDSQRIFDVASLGPLMLPGPVILVMGLIYLLFLIGPWSLVAMGAYGAFYPFMLMISKFTNYYRKRCILITDKRVRMMNELLTCIKLIKMYAWEKSFAKAIGAIRAEERSALEKGAYLQSISISVAPIVPVMGAVFTFLGFVLTGNDLTPVVAFTMIAVLNSMRFSLGVLPYSVKALADVRVSFERFKSILLMDEMQPHPWEIFNDKYAIVLNKAVFKWEIDSTQKSCIKANADIKDPSSKGGDKSLKKNEEMQILKDSDLDNGDINFINTPTVQDITFAVERSKLVGICGSVGCGKSSLLSAILGRMIHVSGKIAVNGSIAYVSQQAWIMNTTVRDNILFGVEYDKDRYNVVVESCCLKEDFDDFVQGDLTEIGERGINLSGGQKQRISLARAVYSNKDIYLLDDPLSAVDVHVGRHIFSECIAKQLKGKTVLFITHQLQYLNQCDSVIFLQNGKILDSGTHSEMMQNDTEYANLIKIFYTKAEKEENLADKPKALHRQFSVDRPDDIMLRRDPLRQMSLMSNRTMSIDEEVFNDTEVKLIVAEEMKDGSVGWPVYQTYIKAAGGYLVSFGVMLTFVIAIGSQSFTTWWLSYWLNQGSGNTTVTRGNITFISDSISHNPNVTFYTIVYGSSVAVMAVSTTFRAYVFMKVTLLASSSIHKNIFQKIMWSPMKFFDTTPVGRIINRFSGDLDEIDVRLPSTCEMFIQNLLLILFALGMIAYVSQWFLIALVPLIITFVVFSYIFTSGIRDLMKMNSISKSPLISHVTATVQGISTIYAYGKTDQFMKTWLSFRMDLISISVIGVCGLCVVLTYQSLTPALAGLAMSFAVQMTGLFQFTMRQSIETESKFVAVQRLQHYSKDAESEAPAIIPDKRPPENWPVKGEIKFDRYKLRYRDKLPLALKGIGFTIKGQEKVGIVGRSGSGKSSLGVALFRLVEPASGTIYIDGVDITQIGLEDLRSRLAIIPQDPVLFVGTVRYNLDPFGKYTDSELWEALEKCHVKNTIASLELKLDHAVVENGENFSVGERQLICMARALLRNSKILMLDEATAAIDTETDALVQKTIKEAFAQCTMLIIAHRLNTVLGCDRILVIDDGKVVEFGRPKDLMANNKSKFKAMLDALEKQQ